ncbi:MAG: hypothetical protein AAF627_08120 [Myxococcota bacterium]
MRSSDADVLRAPSMYRGLLTLTLLLPAASVHADDRADALARAVLEAAGDPYQQRFIRFAFVVKKEGQEVLRREHVWCPQRNVVDVDGVRISAVDGRALGDANAAAAEKAWMAFVNDAYWIFTPAKLMDPGVNRELLEDGRLRISFAQVGLTPGDVYTLRFDEDKRLVQWDYTLQSGHEAAFSWEDYTKVGGLRVARSHHALPKGEGISILFEDLEVADVCPL